MPASEPIGRSESATILRNQLWPVIILLIVLFAAVPGVAARQIVGQKDQCKNAGTENLHDAQEENREE